MLTHCTGTSQTIVWRTSGMSNSDSTTKVCKKCNQCDFDAYGKCRACTKKVRAIWVANNKEKLKAYDAARYENQVEKFKKKNAERYYSDPEKYRAMTKAWRDKNKEHVKATALAYARKNRERVRSTASAWHKKNPDARRIFQHNRQAALMATGKLSPGLSRKLFKLQKGKCPCCGLALGDDYHMDHIKPLGLGGSNTDENIQLLRSECNLKKHMKDPIDFMQSKGFLI